MWQKNKKAYKSIKVQMVNQVKAAGRINSFRNEGGMLLQETNGSLANKGIHESMI